MNRNIAVGHPMKSISLFEPSNIIESMADNCLNITPILNVVFTVVFTFSENSVTIICKKVDIVDYLSTQSKKSYAVSILSHLSLVAYIWSPSLVVVG